MQIDYVCGKQIVIETKNVLDLNNWVLFLMTMPMAYQCYLIGC